MKIKSISDLLIKPIITEKSTLLQESGKYTFEVSKHATKPQIKSAISELFDVSVSSVNILVRKGKPKTFGRNRIISPQTKRAIVTLKDGQTLTIFEGA
jgi:large subunit ribosomal protein L23